MQSTSKNDGNKKSGFKCPTFSVPGKTKVNQPSEQVVPPPNKPGPGGDTDSENKASITEVLKPTGHGDSSFDVENISSVTTSKKDVTFKPFKSEKNTTEEAVLLKKIAEKKPKFCMKPSTTGSSSSSTLGNEDKKTKSKKKKSESENSQKTEKDKTKKLEKREEKVKKATDNKKVTTVKDEKKSSMDNQKQKKIMPVRSLSDAEYDAIFTSAVENAMALNLKEWQPKVTSPAKVKEKKKYSITVGRKVKQQVPDKKTNELGDSLVEGASETPTISTTVNKRDDDDLHSEDEEVHTVNGVLDDETDDFDAEDEAVVVEDKLDDNNSASDGDDNGDIMPNEENVNVEAMESTAQGENEITPPVSVVDVAEKLPLNVSTPIKKKKKILKAKKKLEPKHLPFNDSKELSMVDKICKMKQLKKLKEESAAKKDRLRDCEKEQVHSKPVKSSEKKISRKRKMQERELDAKGTWVMCCNSDCMKWRYLQDVCDPSLVPDRWTCSMNTSTEYNSCDKPEENYDESEHIYTKFTEGSIVWAKMTGYPWWPAMVEVDPDTETFFRIASEDSMIPTHYHVVFFGDHVSRVWVKPALLVQFTGDDEKDGVLMQSSKRKSSSKGDVAKAKKNALNALKCTMKERIELFGFAARYKGPWASNRKAKSKKTKTSTKQAKIEETEYLDDNTVDEVLENTESLLDNVEEMLNSLDSELDDTDEDSDFVPGKPVEVEKKSKTARKVVFNEALKTNMSDFDDLKKKVSDDVTVDSDIDSGEAQAQDEYSNVENDLENKDANNFDVKVQSGEGIETDYEKNGKEKKQGVEKRNGNKHRISKIHKNKTAVEELERETKIEVKKMKVQNEDQKKLLNVDDNKKKEGKSKKIFSLPKARKVVVKDNETSRGIVQSINDEKDKTDIEVEDFDLLVDEEDCVKPVNSDIFSEENSDDKHNDDGLELIDDKTDTKSEAVTAHRNTEQSLDEDAGDDFDLEEHYMYDTNSDAPGKIRELTNLIGNGPATSEIEEYSDPFELLEE